MLNFLRLALVTRDVALSWRLAYARVPFSHIENRSGTTYFAGSDLRCRDAVDIVSPGVSYWITQLGRWGFSFEVRPNCPLILKCGEVRLFADGADVCGIALEVFGSLEYGIRLSRPSIIIDIGMNVGSTALYFASQMLCEKVFGFEPVLSTFRRAERNFALNPRIGGKIVAHQFGLGQGDYEARAVTDAASSGLTRTVRKEPTDTDFDAEGVAIRDAAKQIENILADSGDRDVYLKVDCEGGEREVFKSIPDGILRRFHAVVLEWHSAEILEEIAVKLGENDFLTFNTRLNSDVGLLYAARR
jgi:FkbM family methyltransferase